MNTDDDEFGRDLFAIAFDEQSFSTRSSESFRLRIEDGVVNLKECDICESVNATQMQTCECKCTLCYRCALKFIECPQCRTIPIVKLLDLKHDFKENIILVATEITLSRKIWYPLARIEQCAALKLYKFLCNIRAVSKPEKIQLRHVFK